MPRKTDYAKGYTAGLVAIKKMPKRYQEYRHSYRKEIESKLRDIADKYSDSIGDAPCEFTNEPSYMRTSWYRDGLEDAIFSADVVNKWIVCKFSGQGYYTVESIADQALYDDPCFAWKRSWELDPHGHNFTSKPIRYVGGACKHLGIEVA